VDSLVDPIPTFKPISVPVYAAIIEN